MKIMISPIHENDFSTETVEGKVEVFSSCVSGWQLDIAEELIGTNERAGFAALFIVTSYFEMIGAILGKQKNEEKVRSGFKLVFPEFLEENNTNSRIVNTINSDLRNGLYHHGLAKAGIVLTQDIDQPILPNDPQSSNFFVLINPVRFVERIREHFASFCANLRDPRNEELRQSFSKFFSSRDVVGVQKPPIQASEAGRKASFPCQNPHGNGGIVDESLVCCNRWTPPKSHP